MNVPKQYIFNRGICLFALHICSCVVLVISVFTSDLSATTYDDFALNSCERAAQVSIKLGFRYNKVKPYGLKNPKNWGVDWYDVVTLCRNGRECGPLKALFDKYANQADKLVYRFMADDSFALICYVDKPSKKYAGRSISMHLCNPESMYGCIPFCDNFGGATYSCKTGREH